MSKAILTLNAGSSSIKFKFFPVASSIEQNTFVCEGGIDGLPHTAHFVVRGSSGQSLVETSLPGVANHETALRVLFAWLGEHYVDWKLLAAGHRVVHGGTRFTEPVLINGEILTSLRSLIPLAPLHQPHNLAAVDALAILHPGLLQVACFDTAFHHTEPPVAVEFALPREITEEGVRRYGFHGLSYEFIASVLPQFVGPILSGGRIIVAHLGSGASLCALHRRESVATTMGFTALDGLMMARRCGAIDPGVILYLLQQKHMDADSITDLLYNRSGLLGVSGISDDMRELLATPDLRAKSAVDLFVYRINREIGSLAAALGGLDALIFTAGIGENAPEIRRRICTGAKWLGIELDEHANALGGPCISRSSVSAWVIPTDEDLMIARHTLDLISKSPSLSLTGDLM